mmetsp:Transcript_47821/g.126648  ORF Transcript_47821/g.126648 Transcript_47821/m.126648 type:complete len:434 (+) Transcript_47821:20-1321(+)
MSRPGSAATLSELSYFAQGRVLSPSGSEVSGFSQRGSTVGVRDAAKVKQARAMRAQLRTELEAADRAMQLQGAEAIRAAEEACQEEAAAERSKWEQQIHAEEAALAEEQAELMALQSEVKAASAAAQQAEEDASRAKEDERGVELALQAKRELGSAEASEVARMSAMLAQAQQELEEAIRTEAELEQEVARASGDIAGCAGTGHLDRLRDEVESERAAASQAREARVHAEAEVEKQGQALAGKRREMQYWKAQAQQLTNELQGLRAQVAKASSERSALMEDLRAAGELDAPGVGATGGAPDAQAPAGDSRLAALQEELDYQRQQHAERLAEAETEASNAAATLRSEIACAALRDDLAAARERSLAASVDALKAQLRALELRVDGDGQAPASAGSEGRTKASGDRPGQPAQTAPRSAVSLYQEDGNSTGGFAPR